MATERFTPRLVLGAFLILVGVLFTAANLGLVEARQYLRYWPLVFVLIGLTHFAGTRQRGRLAGLIWIVVGVWWTASNLRLIPFSFWDLWPGAVILLVGVALVSGALRGPRRPADAPEAGGEDVVHMFAMMGGNERRVASKGFRGGDMTAIMGGCVLDLREAQPIAEGAVLDVFALMGGIELKVPEDWSVEIEGAPVMGAFEDKTRGSDRDSAKRLKVRGAVVMGGLEIKN
jgi:predicted membrane protein